MKKYLYKITIYNYFNIEIYSEIIKAEDENKAIIEALKSEIISDGDTIKIEEVEG